MSTLLRAAAPLLLALVVAGCASAPGRTTNKESFEGFNRGVYKFNDALDRGALKPVAKGYRKVVPQFVRTGVGNVLSNLEGPGTFINQFLQGKVVLGLKDTGRFLINTTLGVVGIFDVATPLGLEKNDEDFGQTLAHWGVPSGPYLMLPLFGPSSVRDAPSRVFDWFVTPLQYTDLPWQADWAQRLISPIHTRSELLPLDATIKRAYDPYVFIRDAWVQQREFKIFDGNPPPETLEDIEEPEEDEESPPETPPK
ncbi:MlaA family lipoprotein [Steroidobacter cummioxidans]|uniref:MlaA family lipoprotein n=1 Tax=Steroidobacter cummioxidans TaxID=1803913 RepID=UPI000E31EF45|nr:VacJ family lipoprotein [Steroidobacter cummioxidans]